MNVKREPFGRIIISAITDELEFQDIRVKER